MRVSLPYMRVRALSHRDVSLTDHSLDIDLSTTTTFATFTAPLVPIKVVGRPKLDSHAVCEVARCLRKGLDRDVH